MIKNISYIIFILLLSQRVFPCNKVIFGDLDWDSSRFHVEVASFILEKGLDCKTDKIPGTTMPLLTALGKGDIHVLMEVWKQNLEDAWGKLESSGKASDLGVNIPDAIQGWFIPRYLQSSYPDLRKVEDLPKFKNLFQDPEAPSKGRFYNCILGWSCEDVNTKKLKAYKLLDDFTNFRPGTGAALSAVIASKYQKKQPFVAYYWGRHGFSESMT